MTILRTRYISYLLACAIVSLCPATSRAVPASPNIITLKQSDGSAFEARQWGDERSHGWETQSGHTIVFDKTIKSWAYAVHDKNGRLASSSVRVDRSKQPPASIAKKLRPHKVSAARGIRMAAPSPATVDSKAGPALSPDAPVTVTKSLPVILIGYADAGFTKTKADFDNLLFGGGNSLRNYYQENSYGQLTVDGGSGGVFGPVTSDFVRTYYGANDAAGNDRYPGTLVYEAVSKAAAGGFLFAPYLDQTKGCYVDVVMIAHQGTGEEVGYDANDIWSHSWDLNSANGLENYKTGNGEFVTSEPCSYPGGGGFITVNNYVIQPELATPNPGGRLIGVGVFAHEFGHSIGLPDLYDMDGSSEGAGNWTLMASGSWLGPLVPFSWNGSDYAWAMGDSPSHLDPWSKYFMGWITPADISGNNPDLPVAAASSPSATFYKLGAGTPTSGEYFLVENRYKSGFDSYLDGSGLMVWHIDGATISSLIPANTINSNECTSTVPGACSGAANHYGVAPLQADSALHLENGLNRGDAADPFNAPQFFSDASAPASTLWDGTASWADVSYLSASGPIMTATFSFVPGLVNGICGNANGRIFASAPATAPGLCSSGSASAVAGSGPWSWSCTGAGGGATAYCGTGTAIAAADFSSCALPAGWSVVDNVGAGDVWSFNNPAGRTNQTGGAGCFAIADSDWAGLGSHMDTELRSPSYDLSHYAAVRLDFRTYYLNYSNDIAAVDVSGDGGATWVTVWEKKGANYSGNESIDISSIAAGKADVKFRFHYYDAYFDWYWQVDDVVLSGASAPRARIGSVGYSSLVTAYAAAVTGDVIKALAGALPDNGLNINDALAGGKEVFILGGYDIDYSSRNGLPVTYLKGPLTISSGRATIDGLTIRP